MDGAWTDGQTKKMMKKIERKKTKKKKQKRKLPDASSDFDPVLIKKNVLQVGVMMKGPTIEKAIRYSLLFLSILQ